ncbi:lipase family protein [Streptomyces sp. NPDC048496]|uniref:lipase family protein n=1 Tax=Streptomyces sp. NPDC048496 TaxID=3365558 RepID=UPI0037168CA7
MASTGEVHGFESLAERRLLLALDFTGGAVTVLSQPFELRLSSTKGKGVHVPDFLVVTDGPVLLVDVRPAHRVKDADAVKFAAATQAATAASWDSSAPPSSCHAAEPDMVTRAQIPRTRTALDTALTSVLSDAGLKAVAHADGFILVTPGEYSTIVAEQQLGTRRPVAPVLLSHSVLDDVIPHQVSEKLAASWCRRGATVKFTSNYVPGHIAATAATSIGAPPG